MAENRLNDNNSQHMRGIAGCQDTFAGLYTTKNLDQSMVKGMDVLGQKPGADSSRFLMQHNRLKEQRLIMAFWLMDLLNLSKSIRRLKVILPFVVNFDLIMSSVPPVTDMLQHIADRLTGNRDRTGSVRPPSNASSQNSLADFEPGIKLPVHLLMQTHVDLLLVHGTMDNCYVFLMKSGGQEDYNEVPTAVRKQCGLTNKLMGHSKEDKRICQWNKIRMNMMMPKTNSSTVAEGIPNTIFNKTASSRCEIELTNVPSLRNKPQTRTGFNSVPSRDVRKESEKEVDENGQTKKKKGMRKRIMGRIRLLNGKKKRSEEKINGHKSKKVKKILISRKGDKKSSDCITETNSSSSEENQLDSDSKEKLVNRKTLDNVVTKVTEDNKISKKGKKGFKKRLMSPFRSKKHRNDNAKADGKGKLEKKQRGFSYDKSSSDSPTDELFSKNTRTCNSNSDCITKGEECASTKKKKLHIKRRIRDKFGFSKTKDKQTATSSDTCDKHSTPNDESTCQAELNDRKLVYVVDKDIDITDDTETDAVSETYIHIGIIGSVESEGKTKKKRSLKKKVTAPFRWIKKNF